MSGHFPGSRGPELHFMKIYLTKFLFGAGKLKPPQRENTLETPKPNMLYSCVQVCTPVQKTLVQYEQIVAGHHSTVADMSSKALLVLVKSYK